MKYIFSIFILLILHGASIAQNDLTDTLALPEVVVKAFENNRKLIDVPAAISIVTKRDLNKFSNVSILPALNAKPGVRMEERSPGSYRLSIRGSSLRSPFGVRNVKVYYDGIPYTDPGGSTYLNQLGFYNIQSVEIIKGPAGSLYGAGTGGVLLIRNDAKQFHPGVSVGYNFGSYNLNNVNASVRLGTEASNNTVTYQHLSSDGYRDHTNLRRDVVTWDAVTKPTEKSQLQAHFLYSDLYYQTPGALTKKEFDLNPRAARPAAGPNPSAEASKAAFYQKSFFAGLSYDQKFSEAWKNTTSIYGDYTFTKNPTVRNYERRTEPHFGGRTVFEYTKKINVTQLTFHGGAEYQQSFNTQRVYDNRNGETDSLQTDDEILNNQGFIFLQGIAEMPHGWVVTAAASLNKSGLNFRRLSEVPAVNDSRSFNNEISPRISLLKEFAKRISVYGSIARGFSPPTTSEILPSINVFNTNLQAESGINYEFGSRGSLLRNKLYFDINLFLYKLKNAIVQRRDAGGADYFDNAGSANQNGLETFVSYELINTQLKFFNHASLYVSDTWNNFHYDDFKQSSNDFSGKKIPGVASQTVAAGFDISTKIGLYANTNFFYSSRIALNDANSSYASAYTLVGMRLGYKSNFLKKTQWEIFCGAENIFDEEYSLGNDINAFGGRYYNIAPGRNYYAGIAFNFNTK